MFIRLTTWRMLALQLLVQIRLIVTSATVNFDGFSILNSDQFSIKAQPHINKHISELDLAWQIQSYHYIFFFSQANELVICMCINTCLSKVQTKVCAGTQHHGSKLVYMLLPNRVAQIYQNEAQA